MPTPADPPPSDRLPPIVERALRLLPLMAVGNLLLAAPALIVSLAVAYFTFIQAEATQKMQIASVWPRIAYETSNIGDDGTRRITLQLTNQGVGPARVQGMEVRYKGRPYTSLDALLTACCSGGEDDWTLMVGDVNGTVLRPGEKAEFAIVRPDLATEGVYRRFDRERFSTAVQVCYCSVFDDCWIAGSGNGEPRAVALCPADWVQFGRRS